jgi:hypothetical protein
MLLQNLLINDNLGFVENYQQVIIMIIVIFEIPMRSLEELNKEAGEINLQIRRLLLNNYSYDDGIAQQLTKINTVATLRAKLVAIEREIRLRSEG